MLWPSRLSNKLPMLLLTVCLAATTASYDTTAAASEEATGYERADAQTVKAYTQEVISDPRFAERISFRQWLLQKLARWAGPSIRLSPPVAQGLLWAIITWSVLTLLAIMAHLIWTIWLLARPVSHSAPRKGRPESGSYDSATAEQLWQRSGELAHRGAFREAIEVLLVALLRKLESQQVLKFHESKTNGEYVREYPGQLSGCREFTEFVTAFEQNIYGGLRIQEQTHRTMNSLAERIVRNASQSAQV